jgi:hypothetical protein
MDDLGPMIDAQTTIWLLGGEELIRSAGDVLMASSEVIARSTALSESQKPGEMNTTGDYLREAIRRMKQLPKDPELEAARNEAVLHQGRRCREFADVMRRHLKTNDAQALLRTFPIPNDFDSTSTSAGDKGAMSS